jgi:glycosyltransferase involved in cell wall biosynthesis
MRIAALEPYAALSHRLFLDGLAEHSAHEVMPLTLPARRWKWRMRTASLHYAQLLRETGPWDLLFASDYVNLAELVALLPPELAALPRAVYFHENQLTYPLQPGERRDHHFALVHLHAGLCADGVAFNSGFHRTALLEALPELLAHALDVDTEGPLATLAERSRVLPLGTDAPRGEPRGAGDGPPVVLWSHRWEHDKGPDLLAGALGALDEAGEEHRLLLLGERFRQRPPELEALLADRPDRVVDPGFLEDRGAYLEAVASAHVVLSTARHEFFGLGTLEALRAGLMPCLPADLAYPELLPETERAPGAFLWDRNEGPGPALARAVRAVREGGLLERRSALVDHTDRFTWERVAPRFDSWWEELAAGRSASTGRA